MSYSENCWQFGEQYLTAQISPICLDSWNSHRFFNVSYTWYKSLFMPQVGALNWHLKTLIVPKKVLRHVLLQHCAVSISAMAPLMMKKTLLLYLHSTARDNCKFLFEKWGIFIACQMIYTRKTCSCLFVRYFRTLCWDLSR